MFAPESRAMRDEVHGVELRRCTADIVEIAARRGRARDLQSLANTRDLPLPAFGRFATAAERLVLCVRPDRWLLLSPCAPAGATVTDWQAACGGIGVAVDLSSGLTGFHLAGPATREVLARTCRLDLDTDAFSAGRAAATILAQVSAILVALPSGLLLLTPSTTARHFSEWLISAAQPFGFMRRPDLTVADLHGRAGS